MDKIRVTLNVKQGQAISRYILENRKHLIDELVVKDSYCAELNDEFIKSMCNAVDKNGNRSGGRLSLLDISSATAYYYKDANSFSLRSDSFAGCLTLQKIFLGKLIDINPHCFSGCVSLEYIGYSDFNTYHSSYGILYKVGKYRVYPNDYVDFENKWILVKYPAAKKEVKEILSSQVYEIMDYAFEDFPGTDLYFGSIPPICTQNAFYKLDTSKIKLHIPKDSFNSYWCHPVWSTFNIVAE